MFCTGLVVAALFVLVVWVAWSEMHHTDGTDHAWRSKHTPHKKRRRWR